MTEFSINVQNETGFGIAGSTFPAPLNLTQRVVTANDSSYSNNFGNMFNRSGSNNLPSISIVGHLAEFNGAGLRQLAPGLGSANFLNAATRLILDENGPSSPTALELACEDDTRIDESIIIKAVELNNGVAITHTSNPIRLNGHTAVPVEWPGEQFRIFRLTDMYVYNHANGQSSGAKPNDGVVHVFDAGTTISNGEPSGGGNNNFRWGSLELSDGIKTDGAYYLEPNKTFYGTTISIMNDGSIEDAVKTSIQYKPSNRDWWSTYGNFNANTAITIPIYDMEVVANSFGADIRIIGAESNLNQGTVSKLTVKLNGFVSN